MPYANLAVVQGYVNKTINVYKTKSGKNLYRFSLYVRTGKNKNIIPVLAFENQGKKVSPGDLVLINGYIQSNFYRERLDTIIIANYITVLNKKEEQNIEDIGEAVEPEFVEDNEETIPETEEPPF